ncbi:MAG: hypothetical protein K1000chlam4_00485 [Chlamydiae bacterium]|nr:hypothetical protein [Chlamydiota bacterium]
MAIQAVANGRSIIYSSCQDPENKVSDKLALFLSKMRKQKIKSGICASDLMEEVGMLATQLSNKNLKKAPDIKAYLLAKCFKNTDYQTGCDFQYEASISECHTAVARIHKMFTKIQAGTFKERKNNVASSGSEKKSLPKYIPVILYNHIMSCEDCSKKYETLSPSAQSDLHMLVFTSDQEVRSTIRETFSSSAEEQTTITLIEQHIQASRRVDHLQSLFAQPSETN